MYNQKQSNPNIADVNNLEEIIKFFIEYEKNNPSYNLKKAKKILKTIVDESKFVIVKRKDLFYEYEEVARIVYNLNNQDFTILKNFFGLNECNRKRENDYEVLETINSEFKKVRQNKAFLHFINNIKLNSYQRVYMDQSIKKADEAEKKANKLEGKIVEIANLGKTAKKLAKAAKKKINGMYSEFVSILAIFTAMSFAMMGSVQALGNLFKDIKKPSIETLSYALIIGGIYLIILYVVIMLLVMSIKKLFDNSILSQKYPINYGFTILIIILSSSFIISGFALLSKININQVLIALSILAIIICIILLSLMNKERCKYVLRKLINMCNNLVNKFNNLVNKFK